MKLTATERMYITKDIIDRVPDAKLAAEEGTLAHAFESALTAIGDKDLIGFREWVFRNFPEKDTNP